MNYTKEEMMDMVQRSRERLSNTSPRELVLAETTDLDSFPREVYKDVKIKRNKDTSRSSEDTEPATSSSLEANPQKAFDSNIAPARTSSRIHGITVQHVQTKNGVKLNVAIQTVADAEDGLYVELTAELKRHTRLRELKRYPEDDAYFEEHYINTIEEIKSLKDNGRQLCMGRMHERGARGRWFANMFAVGKFSDTNLDVMSQVVIHIGQEEFEILLDGQMSPAQQTLYHSTGIWGSLKTSKPAPRLETAKRKVFK